MTAATRAAAVSPSPRAGVAPAEPIASAAYAYEAYSGEYICECT
jgi:hypothetical protein